MIHMLKFRGRAFQKQIIEISRILCRHLPDCGSARFHAGYGNCENALIHQQNLRPALAVHPLQHAAGYIFLAAVNQYIVPFFTGFQGWKCLPVNVQIHLPLLAVGRRIADLIPSAAMKLGYPAVIQTQIIPIAFITSPIQTTQVHILRQRPVRTDPVLLSGKFAALQLPVGPGAQKMDIGERTGLTVQLVS